MAASGGSPEPSCSVSLQQDRPAVGTRWGPHREQRPRSGTLLGFSGAADPLNRLVRLEQSCRAGQRSCAQLRGPIAGCRPRSSTFVGFSEIRRSVEPPLRLERSASGEARSPPSRWSRRASRSVVVVGDVEIDGRLERHNHLSLGAECASASWPSVLRPSTAVWRQHGRDGWPASTPSFTSGRRAGQRE